MDTLEIAHMTAETLPYKPGDLVPFHLSGGIVVASFFVSLIGAITTVELLQRRTGAKGWTTWWELFSCSVSMGLVAIWCMHYVGNRGIILGGGDPRLQLVYNPGYTALSSFIPIIALFIAFTIADRRHRGKSFLLTALVLSGIVAGLAIVGMHYTANLGVSNYHIDFQKKYVGGAIIIACAACVLSLTLIFMLQELWINYFLSRLLCALCIAGAVCGMHYEGTVGTSYRLKYAVDSGTGLRNTNVITAVIISLLTVPVCLFIAVKANRRHKQLADRAQQVVLACARFDSEGRLMVTHEGLLPCQNITMHENQKSFEDQFNVTHPAFQWIYRASHNWSSITRWLPDMRRHLQSVHFLSDGNGKKSASADSSLFEVNSEGEDYSVIFREGFCCAAASIAQVLRTPVTEMGTLYPEVMMTGTLNLKTLTGRKNFWNRFNPGRSGLIRDVEANMGVDIFGKGQLLLLVHQCDKKEISKLLTDGYRFAPVDKIAEHLARSMRVPLGYLTQHLYALQEQAKQETDVPHGTMLGCFALRAGVSRRTWEVLVKKDMPYRLPWVQVTPKAMDASTAQLLARMDGLSVASCLTYITQRLEASDELNIGFWENFKSKVEELGELVPETFFRHAIFSARSLKVTTLIPGSNQIASCDLLAFHVVPDIHASTLKPTTTHLEYSPLSFLRCRQQALEGAMQNAAFERKVHHEFAPIFATKDTNNVPRPTQAKQKSKPKFFSRAIPLRDMDDVTPKKSESASDDDSFRSHGVEDHAGSMSMSDFGSKKSMGSLTIALPENSGMPFGGIMVSSDVTVETSSVGGKSAGQAVTEFVEGGGVGTSAYASTADAEVPTYVDELYALAVTKWQQR